MSVALGGTRSEHASVFHQLLQVAQGSSEVKERAR